MRRTRRNANAGKKTAEVTVEQDQEVGRILERAARASYATWRPAKVLLGQSQPAGTKALRIAWRNKLLLFTRRSRKIEELSGGRSEDER